MGFDVEGVELALENKEKFIAERMEKMFEEMEAGTTVTQGSSSTESESDGVISVRDRVRWRNESDLDANTIIRRCLFCESGLLRAKERSDSEKNLLRWPQNPELRHGIITAYPYKVKDLNFGLHQLHPLDWAPHAEKMREALVVAPNMSGEKEESHSANILGALNPDIIICAEIKIVLK